MGRYFGTDGIRGEANTGCMTPSSVLRIGQAFGIALRAKAVRPRVLIGKDTRVSGYMFEGALAAGLCSVGADVYFVGPLPTPGVAYLTRGMRATAGIMISASHNPFEDNGFKFFSGDGFKLPDTDEALMEELIDDPGLESKLSPAAAVGRARRIDDAMGQYAVFLKERMPKSLQLDGLRVVIDSAHGAGYRVAPKVFTELGAEVFSMGNEPSGFNINQEYGALHPGKIQEEVHRFRADIGIALDGDADRVVLVDERGQLLDGDGILTLCATEMAAQGQLPGNAIVSTVMSNRGLEAACSPLGIAVYRADVGDRAVLDELQRRRLVLGGEQSGHIIFLDSSTTGDGILAALKVVEFMVRSGKPLSELASRFRKSPQVTHNVRVTSKPPLGELADFQRMLTRCELALGAGGGCWCAIAGRSPSPGSPWRVRTLLRSKPMPTSSRQPWPGTSSSGNLPMAVPNLQFTNLGMRWGGFRPCFLDTPYGRLAYFDTDPQSSMEPAVFLHGLGASAPSFLPVALPAKAKTRVVLPDLFCFQGHSRARGPALTLAEHTHSMELLLGHLGGGRPLDVCGLSLGGWIALRLAAQGAPVRRLALLNPAGILASSYGLRERLLHLKWRTFEEVYNSLFARAPYRGMNPVGLAAKREVFRLLSQPSVRAFLETLRESDFVDNILGQVRAPTLLLWGKRDRFLSSQTPYVFARGLPECEGYLVEGCAHALSLEAPLLVTRLLGRHFRWPPAFRPPALPRAAETLLGSPRLERIC